MRGKLGDAIRLQHILDAICEIDPKLVWEIIRQNIPELKDKIAIIHDSLQSYITRPSLKKIYPITDILKYSLNPSSTQ